MKRNEEVSTVEQEEKRLQELSLIPKAKQTEEERKEYNRLHNRKSRRKTNTTGGMKKLFERAERAETQEQFWQLNRADESPKQLEDWRAQESVILDQLNWMEYWHELTPDDECYVSLPDGLDLLQDSIEKNGFVKDINFNSRVLNEFSPTWAIWNNKTCKDTIWGAITPYWKDTDRLAALIEENDATKIFALYGFRIGVPEYVYLMWKGELRHKVSALGMLRLETLR
jgi:hypothetical protein